MPRDPARPAGTWTAPRAAGRATGPSRRRRTTPGTRPSSAATWPRRRPTTSCSRAVPCSAGWSAWPRLTSPSWSPPRRRWSRCSPAGGCRPAPGWPACRASTHRTSPSCAPTAYGLRPEPLPVDGIGRADVEAVERLLADDPPRLVHLTHIGSHRGLLQPAAEIAVLCRAAGVPLVLDAAQSLGHVDVDLGADVVYSTSRKWLAGPRGVGMLFVRPAVAAQLTPVLPEPEGEPPLRAFESGEAHVAGRIGLVVAVGDHLAAGPDRVRSRLAALGRATREIVGGAGGWTVVEPLDEPTATTTLRPPDGVDVVATRARLLNDHGLVTTAIGPQRAPGEMTGSVLRISPHVDATIEELEALAAAL
ncbi:MAG: aminotransferase class V-fold PLP-dependent enzyme [Blastococcus sp.]